MAYIGNEMAACPDHGLIGSSDCIPRRNGLIKGIIEFVDTIRSLDEMQSWMIRRNENETNKRILRFHSQECMQNKSVIISVAAEEEFMHAQMNNMPLNYFFKQGYDGRRCVGMTDKETGFLRHRFCLKFMVSTYKY